MYKYIILILVLFSNKAVLSQFQFEPPEPIEKAGIQAEMQVIYENIENNGYIKNNNITHPSFLLRYGISDKIELQMNLQFMTEHIKQINDATLSYEHHYHTGIQPLKAGIKFSFSGENESLMPAAAMLLNITVPNLASSKFRSSHIAPEIILSASKKIKNITIAGNTGLLWDGESASPAEFYIIAFSYSPIKNISMFAEAYGYLKNDIPADNRIDAGLSFFVSDNLQVEIAAGVGLSKYSPINYFGTGIAYRLPKI